MASDEPGVLTLKTPLGWIAAVGRGETLLLLRIGYRSQRAALDSLAESWSEALHNPWRHPQLVAALRNYADGAPESFDAIEFDQSHLTPFQRRVVQYCRAIGYGETQSYGELAAAAGSPQAARAVGNVMRSNRYPLIVPCHRVLASGGALGGFSAPDGVSFKRRLLELEQAALILR